MPKVFVSYRRDDTLTFTGRVFDRLRSHFGPDSVVMDIDSIPFGVDFVQCKGTRRTQSFEYLNAGDTYNTTIVRFANGRYRVTDIGSIIERGNYD